MNPNIGLNVTCNTNCSHWCPRILRIFCCCCSVDEKTADKTHHVAKARFDADTPSTPEKEVSRENPEN